MTSDIVFGIKHLMVEKGLYQKCVADRAGFSEQQFSDMLNGRKVIRAEYIPSIAKALGVTVNRLFETPPQKQSGKTA